MSPPSDVAVWSAVLVAIGAFSHLGATALLAVEHLGGGRHRRPFGPVAAVGPVLLAAALTWPLADPTPVVVVAGVVVLLAALVAAGLPALRGSGIVALGSMIVCSFGLLGYSAWFFWTIPVGTVTRTLMLLGLVPAAGLAPVMVVRGFESQESLIRVHWRRPRAPVPAGGRRPRVAIHVPVHAEPPDVVIGTLDALARLRYPDFEVQVIDNNTTDPDLWRPVREHCAALGPRFRFRRVEGITGAKAGALNLALRETAPDVELIAVVDADYQAEPRFLIDTVGFFADPRTGFVQTPHAYRDWSDSRYLRMCNWEYAEVFHMGMPSLNERDAAPTVGTMCVLRRSALEQVGGWAEWCLTEDSELSIRLHAAGWTSVYLNRIYGRGLIPDTFAGYRRQRFRWTCGPVQELRRHHRLFRPAAGPGAVRSRLTRAQKVHMLVKGAHEALLPLAAVAVGLSAAVAVSMAVHQEAVGVPAPLWVAGGTVLVSAFANRWLVYRALLGARLPDALGATLAGAALMHAKLAGATAGVLGRAVPWRRTDKFRRAGRGLRALADVRAELVVGVGSLALAVAVGVALPRGLALALAVALAGFGLTYLAAPVLALLAERDLRRRAVGSVVPPADLPRHHPTTVPEG